MAQIRLRIEMNKGRTGASLEKLGAITRQVDRFLRAITDGLKIDVKKGEWLAQQFRNGSVSYDAALQVEVSDDSVRRFNQCIEFVTGYDPDAGTVNLLASDVVLLEFGRLGEQIEPDETIGLGIFSPGRKRPKWRRIEYRKASRIRRAIEQPISSYGSVQGLFYSLLKEAQRPYFELREIATNRLIKCFYKDSLYPEIVDGLRFRATIIHASGQLRLDRATRGVEEMQVERLDRVEPVAAEEFASFFGIAPKLTGESTTQEFIDELRDDG